MQTGRDVIVDGMRSDERELVRQIKAGNVEAFDALIDRLYQKLLNFTTHIVHSDEDAEDVVQSVFMNIWRRPEKWNPQSSVDSYLFRSSMNAALNLMRSKRHHEDIDELAGSIHSPEFQPDRILHEEELDRMVQKALDAIPEKYRIPFILSRFVKLKYRSIAEVLQTTEKAVEKRIGRALKLLKEKLEPYLGDH
jgi:RNA polymerase sigma-70 factor (ECF subfamily)